MAKRYASLAELEKYIRDAARRRGIDPDIAVKVAKSEGLNNLAARQPGWQSTVRKNGKREQSYGPFQMLIGGMGSDFQRATGLNVRDEKTVFAQIEFALDQAAKGGWGPWYGAAKVGVSKRQGLANARAVGNRQTYIAASNRTPSGGTRTGSDFAQLASAGPMAYLPPPLPQLKPDREGAMRLAEDAGQAPSALRAAADRARARVTQAAELRTFDPHWTRPNTLQKPLTAPPPNTVVADATRNIGNLLGAPVVQQAGEIASARMGLPSGIDVPPVVSPDLLRPPTGPQVAAAYPNDNRYKMGALPIRSQTVDAETEQARQVAAADIPSDPDVSSGRFAPDLTAPFVTGPNRQPDRTVSEIPPPSPPQGNFLGWNDLLDPNKDPKAVGAEMKRKGTALVQSDGFGGITKEVVERRLQAEILNWAVQPENYETALANGDRLESSGLSRGVTAILGQMRGEVLQRQKANPLQPVTRTIPGGERFDTSNVSPGIFGQSPPRGGAPAQHRSPIAHAVSSLPSAPVPQRQSRPSAGLTVAPYNFRGERPLAEPPPFAPAPTPSPSTTPLHVPAAGTLTQPYELRRAAGTWTEPYETPTAPAAPLMSYEGARDRLPSSVRGVSDTIANISDTLRGGIVDAARTITDPDAWRYAFLGPQVNRAAKSDALAPAAPRAPDTVVRRVDDPVFAPQFTELTGGLSWGDYNATPTRVRTARETVGMAPMQLAWPTANQSIDYVNAIGNPGTPQARRIEAPRATQPRVETVRTNVNPSSATQVADSAPQPDVSSGRFNPAHLIPKGVPLKGNQYDPASFSPYIDAVRAPSYTDLVPDLIQPTTRAEKSMGPSLPTPMGIGPMGFPAPNIYDPVVPTGDWKIPTVAPDGQAAPNAGIPTVAPVAPTPVDFLNVPGPGMAGVMPSLAPVLNSPTRNLGYRFQGGVGGVMPAPAFPSAVQLRGGGAVPLSMPRPMNTIGGFAGSGSNAAAIGYQPTKTRSANFNSKSGGSKYDYSTGTRSGGGFAGQYTTNSGKTVTHYTDPYLGHTVSVFN